MEPIIIQQPIHGLRFRPLMVWFIIMEIPPKRGKVIRWVVHRESMPGMWIEWKILGETT